MAKIQFPASSSLSDINGIVKQYEETDGPLTAMGNDGKYTLFTFDAGQDNPAKIASIAPEENGKPVIPAGSTLVCEGTIFISGVLRKSAATR